MRFGNRIFSYKRLGHSRNSSLIGRTVVCEIIPPQGLVKKSSERVMATLLKEKSHKTNPPFPPLSGGQEKAKPSQSGGGASPFYTPLTRGGRGGWFSTKEVGGSRESGLPAKGDVPRERFFQHPPQGSVEKAWSAPPQIANAFFLTLSSRRRACPELVEGRRIEGRGKSNASRRARGHPSIRGSAATQDEAERIFQQARQGGSNINSYGVSPSRFFRRDQ